VRRYINQQQTCSTMIKLLASLCMVFFLCYKSAQAEQGSFRKRTGEATALGQYPFVVLLVGYPRTCKRSGPCHPLGGICTGVLIDKDLVLTAAHCLCGLNPMAYIYPSTLSVSQVKADKKIRSTYANKYPETSKQHCFEGEIEKVRGGIDIAVIRTAPFALDANAAFTSRSEEKGRNAKLTFVGYGGDGGSQSKGEIETLGECDSSLQLEAVDKTICYDPSKNPQTAVFGDAGAPVLDASNKVVGIISGVHNGVGLIASVADNKQFIDDAVTALPPHVQKD